MKENVKNFLIKHNLLSEKTFLVGYSGGYDSTCLLHILSELSKDYGFKLVALHLNHNWRGEEAEKEQINCQNLCAQAGIEFYTKTLPKTDKCSELAAREARYEFFAGCAEKFNAEAIFTAHTKTDNAETVLYRIIKGTGIEGLRGIPEIREEKTYKIYRPLLNFSRAEIEKYNLDNGLKPESDSSNFDIKYARNNIRHSIMPALQKINDNVENALNTLSLLASSELNIVDEYLQQIKSNITTPSTTARDDTKSKKIDTDKFLALTKDVRQKIIFELIKTVKESYDYSDVAEIMNFIDANQNSKNGKIASITKECWLFVSNKYIYTTCDILPQQDCETLEIPAEGTYPCDNYVLKIEKYNNEKVTFSAADFTIFVDLSKISFPLELRKRDITKEDADYIQPFGMTGKMKLKKYFINRHISRFERDKNLLLCKNNDILWVTGVGISEKLRVVEQPTHKISLVLK